MLTADADRTPGSRAPAADARLAAAQGRATTAFARRAMGSPLRLTVTGIAEAEASAGWEAVSEVIEAIEQELSRFRPTSGLMTLNARAGQDDPMPVGRWLGRALSAADRARRLTDGAFDARILGDLERLGYVGAGSPGAASLGDVRRGPGTFDDGRWLHRDPRSARATVAMPVDLGGIGKGLALRWAMAVLRRALPDLARPGTGALLEAGGDLVGCGDAPQGGPWMIGIEDPGGGEEPVVVALPGGAICTSSVAVHRWRDPDGRIVHHLLDPASGEPGGEGLLAVTVAAPDPAWAEVWSKTLFLEGRAGIGARARALGLAAWWIREDGSYGMTPAARARTAWVAGEA